MVITVVLALVVAAGVGLAAHKWIQPRYQATATLMVVPGSHNSDFLSALVTDQQLVDTYASLSTTPNLLTKTLQNLNLNWTWSSFARDVVSTPISSTNLLSIKVTTTNPRLTAQLANQLAANTSNEVTHLVGTHQLEIVDPATVPQSPASSPAKKYGAAAGAIVLVLGAIYILLREYVDDSIHNPDEAEKNLGFTVVGTIPWVVGIHHNTGA